MAHNDTPRHVTIPLPYFMEQHPTRLNQYFTMVPYHTNTLLNDIPQNFTLPERYSTKQYPTVPNQYLILLFYNFITKSPLSTRSPLKKSFIFSIFKPFNNSIFKLVRKQYFKINSTSSRNSLRT